MKVTITSFLIALLLAASGLIASPVLAEESSELTLLVGEQRAIDTTNVASASVGEKKIATAALAGNQLLLSAKSSGITTLTLIYRDGSSFSYTVKVLARDPKKVREEIASLLEDVEGVEVKVVGDRVFVDGFVYREVDQERVKVVVGAFEETVNLTTFSKAYLNMRRLINIDYYRYEVQKLDALSIGINWADFFSEARAVPEYTYLINEGSPIGPTIGSGSILSTEGKDQGGQVALTSDFNPVSLNQDDNRVRLLDQHQVVVKEGSPAEYHVGGEYPIVYVTVSVATVSFKEYGAIFKLTPEIDKQDNINVSLDMTISELDFSVDALGYPGLLVVKQNTELNLKSGETIVIGGYLTERSSKNENGLPGLSQVPVLGYFFGKKNFRKSATEGVVFITPSVASPTDDVRNDPKIRAVLDKYEVDDFKL